MPVTSISGGYRAASSGGMLSRGSRGPQVSELQQQLAAAGFDPGPIDGDFGPQTEAALRAFQSARGIDVDGVAGPQTFGALGASSPAPSGGGGADGGGHPTLSQGSRGGAVMELQRALAGSGFDPGPIDGDFGAMTRNAVVRYQSAHGLSVDGVVGPQTWGALGGDSFAPGPSGAPARPPADGDFRSRIIDVAGAEIGTVEATNNNDGAVGKYPGYFGRAPESYCANFVSWVLSNSGEHVDYFNTETMKRAWINEGKWKGRNDPQPGDVVWFDWNQDGVTDHVGLVKSVNANGTITTIEGNTGGPGGQEGVWEKTRTWDTITGFGNP